VKIVIRHGIFSSATKMAKLEAHLRGDFPAAVVDNDSYTWTDSILVNGARLAKRLTKAAERDARETCVILVGHSMGGLVCRVANCALSDPGFPQHVRANARAIGMLDLCEIDELVGLNSSVHVCGIVTLATPNSGAMTFAQMHALGALLGLALPLNLRSAGIQDLRTDHIFRVLQHCHTDASCLTISGSHGNRFGTGTARTAVRYLSRWVTNLREPNDMIVEDESVDLSRSILPHESGLRTEHVRRYVDCTDVSHTSIHGNPRVLESVSSFIARCIAACGCDNAM